MLKFSPMRHNAKLAKLVKKTGGKGYTFSLLSGHTCPYAKECYSKAVPNERGTLTVVDGPDTKFRCFSATQEMVFGPVYRQRSYNTGLLRSLKNSAEMADLITRSVPKDATLIRIHVGGDFFNQAYFDAWIAVAILNPKVRFYAYTKALPFWIARLGSIPTNLILTASYGGRKDDLIAKHKLRFAKVVFSQYAARKLKLPIDHDDSHAARPGKSFALLLHGVQPKGSKAAKALKQLKGKGSYSRKAS
jgi:hypothetical protein